MMKKIIRSGIGRLKSLGRRQPLWSQKATLAIEVSGACNLRCPMCSYPHMKRRKGFMDWQLFEKIVADTASNGHGIASLHFFGEPLLWPHIVKGVALLSENGMFPRISTNGMLLTGEMARQLQDAGLKEIMVTIDTLMPEAYPMIRAGGDLAVVRKNIHDALDSAPKLLLSAQFMPSKYNQDEKEEDFYDEFGRRPNFRVEPWFVIRMNKGDNISRGLSHSPDEVDKRLCNKIFDRVDVLWDGTTVLCCLDAEGTLVTGDLNRNSILYSWLGPRAMALRKKILNGRWTQLDTCVQCAADHIPMETDNDSWRLKNPPRPLPPRHGRLLKEIESLGDFDEKNGRWTKVKKR